MSESQSPDQLLHEALSSLEQGRSPKVLAYRASVPEAGIAMLAQFDMRFAETVFVHTHRGAQILWLLEGEAELQLDSQAFPLAAGDGCIIPAKRRHRLYAPAGQSVRLVDLRLTDAGEKFLVSWASASAAVPTFGIGVRRLREMELQLARAAQMEGVGRTAQMMACLWAMLAAAEEGSSHDPNQQPAPNGPDVRLRTAEALLRENLAREWGVEQLAAAVNLSRSQLTRLYLEHLGISPARRLRDLRIARATELLQTTTLSIKEIAHLCGFAAVEHFSRTYRKATGRRPTHSRST
jgi:AraC-like DNA-binding protein/quercetin dioxygenase-like cupin family protein